MTDFCRKETCRLCEGRRLRQVISLTPTPIGGQYVTQQDLDQEEKRYPLDVYFCEDCRHLQLGIVVDPALLYRRRYRYVSGTSPVFTAHLRDYARKITRDYHLSPDGLVIDVGSNDGTALRFFEELGYRVLGIDPAPEIAEQANRSGIETICDFFGRAAAQRYGSRYGRAALITSHNACAHIDDLAGVVEGAREWLDDGGIFVMEVGYLLDVYHNAWFDTIYHEHLDYHSLAPLVQFFERLGMQVIEASRISPQGGSLRLVVQKRGGPYPVRPSVEALMAVERRAGLHDVEAFLRYADRIELVKARLRKLVDRIRAEGRTMAGFGAPTKATTLVSHFDLGGALDFIADDNPLKQNLYTPGHHVPIYAPEAIYERRPDYLLILSWNFAADIMRRHQRYRELGGRFILPMPEPAVVE